MDQLIGELSELFWSLLSTSTSVQRPCGSGDSGCGDFEVLLIWFLDLTLIPMALCILSSCCALRGDCSTLSHNENLCRPDFMLLLSSIPRGRRW